MPLASIPIACQASTLLNHTMMFLAGQARSDVSKQGRGGEHTLKNPRERIEGPFEPKANAQDGGCEEGTTRISPWLFRTPRGRPQDLWRCLHGNSLEQPMCDNMHTASG
jgi:hypothetical protein